MGTIGNMALNVLISVLSTLFEQASPNLRQYINDAVRGLYAKALATETTKGDDLLVKILAALVGTSLDGVTAVIPVGEPMSAAEMQAAISRPVLTLSAPGLLAFLADAPSTIPAGGTDPRPDMQGG